MKKAFILGISLVTFLALASCKKDHKPTEGNATEVTESEGSFVNVNAIEFQKKVKETNDAVILDVRTPEEYSSGKIPNAINIDWNGSSFADEIAKLDASKTYFVYCKSGRRSNSASEFLVEKGFKNIIMLEGGISAWAEAGLEIK